MTSRARFTLDQARAAGERVGVDEGSAPFDLEQFPGEPDGPVVGDDVPCR